MIYLATSLQAACKIYHISCYFILHRMYIPWCYYIKKMDGASMISFISIVFVALYKYTYIVLLHIYMKHTM